MALVVGENAVVFINISGWKLGTLVVSAGTGVCSWGMLRDTDEFAFASAGKTLYGDISNIGRPELAIGDGKRFERGGKLCEREWGIAKETSLGAWDCDSWDCRIGKYGLGLLSTGKRVETCAGVFISTIQLERYPAGWDQRLVCDVSKSKRAIETRRNIEGSQIISHRRTSGLMMTIPPRASEPATILGTSRKWIAYNWSTSISSVLILVITAAFQVLFAIDFANFTAICDTTY